MKYVYWLAAVCILAAFMRGQESSTLHVNAKLVHVPAVVHDKKGALVLTLKKEDFELWVDRKPQEIRYFNNDANLPLTLGLLVDVSGSVASRLDEERKASTAFLDGMLESKDDRAFVIQFGRKADLLADLTNERSKLAEGLKQLEGDSRNAGRDPQFDRDNRDRGNKDDSSGPPPPPPADQFLGQWGGMGGQGRRGGMGGQRGPGGPGGGRGGNMGGGGTVMYDAVFLASDELMKKQTGRKALILLTDGEDRGSKVTLTRALEAAQRSDTIVYAIYYKGESSGGFGGFGGRPGGGGPGRNASSDGDGKKVLQRITQETGGQMFQVSKKETVEEIYKEIARELRSQYRIQFTPSESAATDGYHQIDLVAKDKKYFVQTREGYYVGEAAK